MARVTKKQKVIEFIKAAGSTGLTFSEIQRFVVEKLNGLNYDEKDKDGRRRYRGYWCVMLCGVHGYITGRHEGILETHCMNVDGRYVYDEYASDLNKFLRITN